MAARRGPMRRRWPRSGAVLDGQRAGAASQLVRHQLPGSGVRAAEHGAARPAAGARAGTRAARYRGAIQRRITRGDRLDRRYRDLPVACGGAQLAGGIQCGRETHADRAPNGLLGLCGVCRQRGIC
ncbi:hypothetical protein G6F59_015381 [Rhizopus arrhizus]|nr:hypothetical protein G6F59_015381 [Rhizopus arrhizus]